VVAAVELPVTDEGGPGEVRSCGRAKLPTFWELDGEHKGATGQLLRSESARLGFPPGSSPRPVKWLVPAKYLGCFNTTARHGYDVQCPLMTGQDMPFGAP
jgi:hypothetical protein